MRVRTVLLVWSALLERPFVRGCRRSPMQLLGRAQRMHATTSCLNEPWGANGARSQRFALSPQKSRLFADGFCGRQPMSPISPCGSTPRRKITKNYLGRRHAPAKGHPQLQVRQARRRRRRRQQRWPRRRRLRDAIDRILAGVARHFLGIFFDAEERII